MEEFDKNTQGPEAAEILAAPEGAPDGEIVEKIPEAEIIPRLIREIKQMGNVT